ncbi:hypothetical protein LRH25_07350 [Ideonella azotifigens]|uniref:Uncharacterized protein n=1 Tax=Ideonella azotifigens TaxID=513160 RepID=A0ABN1JQB1_9BURK|nr:hypothetical protein [Ideonella azotifigens]MCD2340157.1 hypothetical protein [Ideonella azotifigens]
MTKSHKQGNKEAKKPKQAPKPEAVVVATSSSKPAMASLAAPAPGRKR